MAQKHDKAQAWAQSDLVPLAGEIIVYDSDADNPKIPAQIKIGDGTTKVKDLPFYDAAFPFVEYKLPVLKLTGDLTNIQEKST
jgi:hypothetical protein